MINTDTHNSGAVQDGIQTHAAATHIIDMGGRLATKFHGLDWDTTNAALYINGLINNAHHEEEPGWLDRIRALLN